MMNWGSNHMANFGAGMGWLGFLGLIFWLVVLIDLILLGFWIWKQIQRK